MSRVGRLHKQLAVVRRHQSLSHRLRRDPVPLLDPPQGGSSDPGTGERGFRVARWTAVDRLHVEELRRLAGRSRRRRTQVHVPAQQAEEHILGDGDHRRQGTGDLLTQREFCAVRRDRPGHHCVTTRINRVCWLL